LHRLPAHLKRRSHLVLELGINDAFRACRSRNSKQSASDHRPSKSAQSNVRIIIAGMQLPNYASDDYVFAFGQIYADLAAKNSAALIPICSKGSAAIRS